MTWHDTTFWALVFFLGEWTIRVIMLATVPFRRTPAAAKGWLLLIFFEPWIGKIAVIDGRVADTGSQNLVAADFKEWIT
jgi:hypothetical protein